MSTEKEFRHELSEVLQSASKAITRVSAQDIEIYSKIFQDIGFAQIPSIIDVDALAVVYRYIFDIASKHFVEFERPERPDLDRQLAGFRLKRAYLEPSSECHISGINDQSWKSLRDQLKQTAIQLTEILQPIINDIAGCYAYQSASIFLYTEGYYAGLHNDAGMGNRLNVQLPLSINTVGGIRILDNERLRMFYDMPGCLNILGPRIWHDIPPILRMPNGDKPLRMNMTLRYML